MQTFYQHNKEFTMLFPGRTDIHAVPEAVVVWPQQKSAEQHYFCPNLSCLSDDLVARPASSFRHVWLVTEVDTNCTWLMMAKTPGCPHCGAPLCAAAPENAQATPTAELPLM
jgi:hypothetical protein